MMVSEIAYNGEEIVMIIGIACVGRDVSQCRESHHFSVVEVKVPHFIYLPLLFFMAAYLDIGWL